MSYSKAGTTRSSRYAWFVVGLLTLAYGVSLLDRWIITLLVGPIKASLSVSDTQMGILMGWAFAIFYLGLGIPMGWLADRVNRRNLIAICIGLWCAMTAACGLSRNFVQIFFARLGIGVGEAALAPAANSLIADYFPREQQSTAISVFNMGVSMGMGVAYLFGGLVVGWANRIAPTEVPVAGLLEPWQVTFLIVGLPGLLLAVLVRTIREPVRSGQVALDGRDAKPSLAGALRYVTKRRLAYATLGLGMATSPLIGYSWLWLPTVFERTFGVAPTEFAFTYGIILLIAGPAGAILAGKISERLYRRGQPDANYITARRSLWIMIVVSTAVPLAPTPTLALILLFPATMAGAATTATGAAAAVFAAPGQYRAQITSFYVLTISVIGLGVGPPLVGWLNDNVFSGDDGVRFSVAFVSGVVCSALTALMFLGRQAYRDVVVDLEQATNEQ
jgi:MFS family permease